MSAVLKVADFHSARLEMEAFGLFPGAIFAASTIAVQLGGSIMLLFDRGARSGAALLIIFTIAASLIGHDFWSLADPVARLHQLNAFLANMGLVGGLVLAVVASRSDRDHRSIDRACAPL